MHNRMLQFTGTMKKNVAKKIITLDNVNLGILNT